MAISKALDSYAKARIAVDALFRDVRAAHELRCPTIPERHKGRSGPYGTAIYNYTRAVNELEHDYTQNVGAVAAQISAISKRGWEKNPKIQNLWHRLAQVVTSFSEHPTKQVGALIISREGVLQAFAANRVPDGIPRRSPHYFEGDRKNYILCAERRALAQILNIKVNKSALESLPEHSRNPVIQAEVQRLNDAIIKKGQVTTVLHRSFMVVTVPPCEQCAQAIVPFTPKGILAATNSGGHFKRESGIRTLLANNIPLLPLPAFV